MSRACAGRCTCCFPVVSVNKNVVVTKRFLALVNFLHGDKLLWQDTGNILDQFEHFKGAGLEAKEGTRLFFFCSASRDCKVIESDDNFVDRQSNIGAKIVNDDLHFAPHGTCSQNQT